MNLNQLISRTRSIVGDRSARRTNGLQWPDREILEALNSANDTLWNACVLFDEGWGQDVATLSDLGVVLSDLGGNVLVGMLPKDVQLIVDVEEGFTSTSQGVQLPKIEVHDRYLRNDPVLGGFSRRGWWQGTDRTIFFTKGGGAPGTAGLRLWFHRSSPQLARFRAISTSTTNLRVEIDTACDETDGGLGALLPRKDYYRNSFLECLDYGGERPETEEVLVSTFVASTHPFWDFTVTSHTAGSDGGIWGTVPMWPSQHHELLCLLAANNVFDKGGDAAGRAIVQADTQRKLLEFTNTMEQRQKQIPRYVNYRSHAT